MKNYPKHENILDELQEAEYGKWMEEKGSELEEEYRNHLDDFYDADEH